MTPGGSSSALAAAREVGLRLNLKIAGGHKGKVHSAAPLSQARSLPGAGERTCFSSSGREEDKSHFLQVPVCSLSEPGIIDRRVEGHLFRRQSVLNFSQSDLNIEKRMSSVKFPNSSKKRCLSTPSLLNPRLLIILIERLFRGMM
jgi:hypothetical protein